MTEKEVVELVKKYLDNHPIPDNKIVVLDHIVRRDGDFWYVPVRPDHPFPKTYQYYEELTEVEMELEEKEQLDVLLVPAG